MTDSALWIAALTGGTAVLASWVTSRGNARAARVQAESTALTEHHNRAQERRRAAYLDFLEQAHVTGEFYFRLGDIYMQVTDPDDRLVRVEKLRADLRDAFDPLMRAGRVVLLEGPVAAAETAERLKQAASDANTALWLISQDKDHAREHFDAAYKTFRTETDSFIEAARAAMTTHALRDPRARRSR